MHLSDLVNPELDARRRMGIYQIIISGPTFTWHPGSSQGSEWACVSDQRRYPAWLASLPAAVLAQAQRISSDFSEIGDTQQISDLSTLANPDEHCYLISTETGTVFEFNNNGLSRCGHTS